jgi:hypothetical protein
VGAYQGAEAIGYVCKIVATRIACADTTHVSTCGVNSSFQPGRTHQLPKQQTRGDYDDGHLLGGMAGAEAILQGTYVFLALAAGDQQRDQQDEERREGEGNKEGKSGLEDDAVYVEDMRVLGLELLDYGYDYCNLD